MTGTSSTHALADTVSVASAVSLAGAGRCGLHGALRVPGDKSISHRALILGALTDGTSTVSGLSAGEDVVATRRALVALGAKVVPTDPGPADPGPADPGPADPGPADPGPSGAPADGAWRITGGRDRLHATPAPLDCGNSGTGMRLLLGILAGLPFASTLTGDASLSQRPMDRVAEPLRAMGALVSGRTARVLPPVGVAGGHLTGITWSPPMASAQVKSCILLAGLDADGETVVHEPVPTRAHTEEMLAAAGADIAMHEDGTGRTIRLRPSELRPTVTAVPGDPSQAAFWVVAGCVVPGSSVTVHDIYQGRERTGFLGVLERMGALLDIDPRGAGISVSTEHGPLTGTDVTAGEIPSLDEVPILAVAAAAATGTTTFHDVGELRVKESDRMTAVANLVGRFGARAEIRDNDLVVHGAGPGGLVAGSIDSVGDHRIAMAAAVAAMAVSGDAGEVSTITGFSVVATSYPSFLEDLERLGGRTDQAPAAGHDGEAR